MAIRWQIVLKVISRLISLIWTILKRYQLYTNFELHGIQVFLATPFLYSRETVDFCISVQEGRRDFSDT